MKGAKVLMRARCLFVALIALLAPAATVSEAQELPSRTIRMVVAFPAGGPTDFVARLLAEKLKPLIGQAIIVENRAGANGAIGAEYVARADPDGTTLFLTTVGAVAVTPHLMAKVAYDPIRDFAPVTLVVRNTTILVVKPDLPVASAKELAALAARDPGAIAIASTGSGSMPHLALELYQAAAGVKFLHVPYRGAAAALSDLLGGQVQGMLADTPVLLSQIEGGKIRPLGAASANRNAALPEVRTLAEQGFADTSADNWYGLLAPARTPAPVIGKLHDAVVAALAEPDMRDKLIRSGAMPASTSPAEFAALMREELARWGRVVREKNIKADD
ncbi:MAG TPA: tripartite tricarboxylate transporter substrate binding protein [Xanthobacteraceae bacterium]|jgi:tripartite-type tricarboxylate transporter receptor subunit TctC